MLAIAELCAADGYCEATTIQLAAIARMSRTNAWRLLRGLESGGWVSVEHGQAKASPLRIQLQMEKLAARAFPTLAEQASERFSWDDGPMTETQLNVDVETDSLGSSANSLLSENVALSSAAVAPDEVPCSQTTSGWQNYDSYPVIESLARIHKTFWDQGLDPYADR